MHKILAFTVLWALALTSCHPRAATHTDSGTTVWDTPIAWVEIGPASARIARLITREKICPAIKIDGQDKDMVVRARPQDDAFPVLTCEAIISPQAQSATIGDQALPLPPAKPRKIAILGDTGCRIKITDHSKSVQNCLSEQDWPFAQIARTIAEQKPDLVIHVGDYLYRETSIDGAPAGDRFEVWQKDFFSPARPLLRVAPWVFVRGNHENCKRGGEGWTRFLDPRLYTHECQNDHDPYWVKLGGFQFAVFDTSGVEDEKANEPHSAKLEKQLEAISKFPIRNAWLFTHKPLWNPLSLEGELNTIGQAATTKLKHFRAVVTGHIHTFAHVMFGDQGPSLYVSGHGGSSLLTLKRPLSLDGMNIGNRTVIKSKVKAEFGFVTLERSASGKAWNLQNHDVQGRIVK